MVSYLEEDIDKIGRIIKKIRQYNLTNTRSGAIEAFLWEIELLLDKKVKVSYAGDKYQ